MKIRYLKTGAVLESGTLMHDIEHHEYLDYEITIDNTHGCHCVFAVCDKDWEDITDQNQEEINKNNIVINYNTKLKVGDLLYTISDAKLLVYRVISICIEYLDENSEKTINGHFTGKEIETDSYIEADLNDVNVTYFTNKAILLKSITDILKN